MELSLREFLKHHCLSDSDGGKNMEVEIAFEEKLYMAIV